MVWVVADVAVGWAMSSNARTWILWTTMVVCTFGAAPARAQPAATFDMTVEDFRSRLDRVIRQDGGDPIRGCRAERGTQVCTFEDRVFQRSVAAMKEANLLNGQFTQQSRLLLEIRGGKVSAIRLTGTREDPANLFAFMSFAMNILMVLDPKLTADDTRREAQTFGWMRGDAAPDIGRERVDIRSYAAITCNAWPSRVNTRVQCDFVPRS